MIEKREINKIGKQKIQKENWSHQDTYDFIEARTDVAKPIIARKLSVIPTKLKLGGRIKNLPYVVLIIFLFIVGTFFNPFPKYEKEIFVGIHLLNLVFIVLVGYKYKTKYKISTKIDKVNGENVYTHIVKFEQEKKNYEDVLDADLD